MGTRNLVKHHGNVRDGLNTALPTALARDGRLTAYARSVALYIWSHAPNFQQSAKAVAEALGIKRDTVSKALAELQAAGWLVREIHRKDDGRPAWERWHLQMSNQPFNQDQIDARVNWHANHEVAHETGTIEVQPGYARSTGTPCPPDGQPPARETGTIDVHLRSTSIDVRPRETVTTKPYGSEWYESGPLSPDPSEHWSSPVGDAPDPWADDAATKAAAAS